MPVKQKRLAHSPCQSYNTPNPESRKTLPGRDWQTPAAPGQEAFLTPYLTTVGAGTRGNSGFKGAKKYLIPSEKHRKALQITTKNLVQAFGSKMPGVRVSPLGPTKVAEKDATPETLAAARVSAVSEGKIEHQTRWRCKRPFS